MSIIPYGVILAKVLLMLASMVSIAVMAERGFALGRERKAEERDFRALREALRAANYDLARQMAAAAEGGSARALQAGFEHGSEDTEIIREAIAQEVVVQTARLQSNLMWLGTIASTAPYVGLFGTVLGILDAFQVIAMTGKTGAAVVAGGISEALVTTALGLGVAIPAVVAYNAFNGKINALSLVIETHAIDLASRLPGHGSNAEMLASISANGSEPKAAKGGGRRETR